MADCAAARAGSFTARLRGFPLSKVRLDITGSADADLDDTSMLTLSERVGPEGRSLMRWRGGGFVGEHWLLGKVRIGFDPSRESGGEIYGFRREGDQVLATHRNQFNFTFSFARLPGVRFTTATPIVNEAEITGIPPIGATYVLPDDEKSRSLLRAGSEKPMGTVDFDYCEITILPEQNITLEVTETRAVAGAVIVTVKLTNLTSESVRATYFVVDHEPEVTPSGDAIFFNIRPHGVATKTFELRSRAVGRTFEMPLYAGVYRPRHLRGSAMTTLSVTF